MAGPQGSGCPSRYACTVQRPYSELSVIDVPATGRAALTEYYVRVTVSPVVGTSLCTGSGLG